MDHSTCRTSRHHPRPMLILREKAFVHWLGKARPGNRITYAEHLGNLGDPVPY